MTEKYIIVSGYHSNRDGLDWFHRLWFDTNLKQAKPERVFIIASGDCVPSVTHGDWIVLSGNLGGGGELLMGQTHWAMCGCAAVWMIGAWLAYANLTDFIYIEQDCLVFGPWVERLYTEIGTKQAIFGRSRAFKSSTTLFMVRHRFIPQFIYDYLQQGPETVPERLPEQKVSRMMEQYPEHYAEYSFGFDRDRPYRVTDSVFYLQKLTRNELFDLSAHRLLTLRGMPNNVDYFSNH